MQHSVLAVNFYWTDQTSDMKMGKKIPLTEIEHSIKIPTSRLKYRINKRHKKSYVDPVTLIIKPTQKNIIELVQKIGKKSKKNKLLWLLNKDLLHKKNKEKTKLVLSKKYSSLINFEKLSKFFTETHLQLLIDTNKLKSNETSFAELLKQTRPFLDNYRFKRLKQKLADNDRLDIEKHILPEFAEKRVRQYGVFKGPNCFRSALAFTDKLFTKAPFYNLKREKKHHPSMINNDELWKILQSNFYEINPRAHALHYADIIVFAEKSSNQDAFQFRAIKHAASALFSHYVFSKGSKSANSSYTISTIHKEWLNWKKRNPKLAIKVFRRAHKDVSKRPPRHLFDWIF